MNYFFTKIFLSFSKYLFSKNFNKQTFYCCHYNETVNSRTFTNLKKSFRLASLLREGIKIRHVRSAS